MTTERHWLVLMLGLSVTAAARRASAATRALAFQNPRSLAPSLRPSANVAALSSSSWSGIRQTPVLADARSDVRVVRL